jgi:3-hydroxyisobutyrate dehydrogenase-like beta-hydroxyacid dehydrogenase
MSAQRVGILHPGDMGVSIALSALDSGCEVYWASDGRRVQSKQRAEAAALKDAGTVSRLCELCPAIVSVCPPEFAWDVARQVIASGFKGAFADINALAPDEKIAMAAEMTAHGIRYADGGIIGLPSRTPGETTVFLSGPAAEEVGACFAKGAIGARVMGTEPGRASALKILFAAYNKGMIALQTELYLAARRYGVFEDLQEQFVHRGLSLEKIELQITRAAPKAWRWQPEMHQIAAALEKVGMPGDFHRGAAEVYRRLAGMKDSPKLPLSQVLDELDRQSPKGD